MALGRGKNRRRTDAAQRAEAMKSFASRAATLVVRLGAALAILAVLFFGGRAAYNWATTSPTFALKTVTVSGTHHSDQSDLCRMAGLTRGQNLVLLDVDAATRAMEQHPWVRSATITRHFPNALSVEIQEHVPAAMVALGELYLLDDQGEPFKKLTAGDSLDLPLVTGLTREDYVARREDCEALMRKALETAHAFGTAQAVSEVRISNDEFTVVTTDGTEVRLGDEATPEKLQRLARVRAELKRRGLSAEVIHLDNRVRPAWVTVKVSTPLSERKPGSMQ